MFDAIVRNGRVVDGTGAPWFPADVGLRDGRIAAVGRLAGAPAALDVDASGLTVAPGFVDIHDHSDFTLVADPRAASAVHQGVTTVVPGNCGFSAAPLLDLAGQRGGLYGYVDGLTPDWRTFGDYLDRLRGAGPAVNVAPLVGHGAIRGAVMGFAARPPSEAEAGRMRAPRRRGAAGGGLRPLGRPGVRSQPERRPGGAPRPPGRGAGAGAPVHGARA